MLVGLLVVWWFVVQEPMLFLLRKSAAAFGGLVFGVPSTRFVTEAPSGDWTFEIPIEFTAAGTSPTSPPVHFHSIDFDMARSDTPAFTFSLPVYWALILAAPWAGRSGRALLLGTILMGLAEIALLLLLVEIFAHKTVAEMSHSRDDVANWLLHLSEYLIVEVIPFVAPFVLAIWLHPGLRECLFGQAIRGTRNILVSGKPTAKRRRLA